MPGVTYPSECSSDSSDLPQLPPWSNTSDLQPLQIHAPNPCHPGRKQGKREREKKKKDFKYCPGPSSIQAVLWKLCTSLWRQTATSEDCSALFKWGILTVARGILQPVFTSLFAKDQLLPSGQSNKDKANESPDCQEYLEWSVFHSLEITRLRIPTGPKGPATWSLLGFNTGNTGLQHRPSCKGFKATRVFQKTVPKDGYERLANGIWESRGAVSPPPKSCSLQDKQGGRAQNRPCVWGRYTVAQKSHGGQPDDRITEGKTWKESQESSNLVVLKERSPDPQAPKHHLETC